MISPRNTIFRAVSSAIPAATGGTIDRVTDAVTDRLTDAGFQIVHDSEAGEQAEPDRDVTFDEYERVVKYITANRGRRNVVRTLCDMLDAADKYVTLNAPVESPDAS